MVWTPRKTMMGAAGQQDQYDLVMQYLFSGASPTAPDPPVDTGGYNHVTTRTGAQYTTDADGAAYQAMTFGALGTDNVTAVRQAITTDLFYGGGRASSAFYAQGYGGAAAGRLIDERNSIDNTGWAIFIHNSSVALSFIIEDSTGRKFWRMTNPRSLFNWYLWRLDFTSDDKVANVPDIRIMAPGDYPSLDDAPSEPLTLVSNTIGVATGRWEAEVAPGTEKIYIGNGNGAALNRNWSGKIDTVELFKKAA